MGRRAPRKQGKTARWFVYFLQCVDGSLYAGCTNDLATRLSRHQSGKGARYTRSRLPVARDRSAALKREAAIKRLTRAQKLSLVAKRASRRTPG